MQKLVDILLNFAIIYGEFIWLSSRMDARGDVIYVQ